MPSIALISWLALTPAATETRIEVSAHKLDPVAAAKPQPGQLSRLVEPPVHGMQVHFDAQGRLVYECQEAHGLPLARSHTHLVEKER